VPEAIVIDFARALGVESAGEDMDVYDGPKKVKGFEGIKMKVKELMREGYSASQILSQLHDLIILHATVTARQKSECALAFAEADKALCDGADEELWILEVGLRIHKAISR